MVWGQCTSEQDRLVVRIATKSYGKEQTLQLKQGDTLILDVTEMENNADRYYYPCVTKSGSTTISAIFGDKYVSVDRYLGLWWWRGEVLVKGTSSVGPRTHKHYLVADHNPSPIHSHPLIYRRLSDSWDNGSFVQIASPYSVTIFYDTMTKAGAATQTKTFTCGLPTRCGAVAYRIYGHPYTAPDDSCRPAPSHVPPLMFRQTPGRPRR